VRIWCWGQCGHGCCEDDDGAVAVLERFEREWEGVEDLESECRCIWV
jgi:hypothetical protein